MPCSSISSDMDVMIGVDVRNPGDEVHIAQRTCREYPFQAIVIPLTIQGMFVSIARVKMLKRNSTSPRHNYLLTFVCM
jgi:hypothetical protein